MKSKINLAIFFCLIPAFCFITEGFPQDSEVARYPQRPISLIVPFSAGGTVDLAFRLVAKEAERHLGQPIVVVNKPGGGGTVGVAAVATAKPDGYTIGQAPGQTVFVMPFLEKLPYSP